MASKDHMVVSTEMIIAAADDVHKDKVDIVDRNTLTFQTEAGDRKDHHMIMTGSNMEILMEVAEARVHTMSMMTAWEIIWVIGGPVLIAAVVVITMREVHRALTAMMI